MNPLKVLRFVFVALIIVSFTTLSASAKMQPEDPLASISQVPTATLAYYDSTGIEHKVFPPCTVAGIQNAILDVMVKYTVMVKNAPQVTDAEWRVTSGGIACIYTTLGQGENFAGYLK